MAHDPLPNYLRLNTAARIPGEVPPFAPWRKIKRGRKCVVIGMGPVLGNLYEMGDEALLDELEIWSVGMLPLDEIPADLIASIEEKQRVVIIEEHYRPCGLAEALSHLLLRQGVCPALLHQPSRKGISRADATAASAGTRKRVGSAGRALRAQLEQVVRG